MENEGAGSTPVERDAVMAALGPNDHLANYLAYYKELEAPRFAVLVTGEWGAGKTFLVEKLLPWKSVDRIALYVSLFGLKSADDVIAAIYAEMDPDGGKLRKLSETAGEASKGVSLFGIGLGGLGSALGGYLSAKLQKEIDRTKTIILDDLERSEISDKALLGVINQYVEHHLCRVVVIAHDEKLVQEIQEAKEKIFGQTIMIEPDVHSAFSAFVDDIANLDARRFVELHHGVITSIFAQSQVKSLRILRQTMLDIARLFESLEQRYLQNQDAMKELISLFAALDFEVRTGRLSKVDLDRRYIKVVEGAVVENTEAFKAEAGRYAEVNLASTLLGNQFLIHSLIQGRYVPAELNESLDASPHFKKPEDMPAWRRVLEFDTLDDASVDIAFAELEREFLDRSITDFGSMLHMFALRMMMAKHGMLTNSIAEIQDQCKEYIEGLLKADRLLPDFDDYDDRSLGRASYGFGYWVEDTFSAEFNDVIDHLRKRSNEALEKTFAPSSQLLLTMLSEDGRAFASSISFSGDGDHRFARVPVLKAVDPEVFVEAWLGAPRANNSWLHIRRGLESRYEGLALTDSAIGQSGRLISERDWIKEVISAMKRHAESATGFARYRIERAIPHIHLPTEE